MSYSFTANIPQHHSQCRLFHNIWTLGPILNLLLQNLMVTLPKVSQSISSKNLPRFCPSIWVVIILPHTCHAPWDILVGMGRMGALINSKGWTTEPLAWWNRRKQTLLRMMLEMVVENEGWGSERTINKILRGNGIVLSYILRPVPSWIYPFEHLTNLEQILHLTQYVQ